MKTVERCHVAPDSGLPREHPAQKYICSKCMRAAKRVADSPAMTEAETNIGDKDRPYLLTVPPQLVEKIRDMFRLVASGNVEQWRAEQCKAAARSLDSQLCDCVTGVGDGETR